MSTNIVKSGIGFDVHKFDKENLSQNNFVMLGGVRIPHSYKIIAHSDGDVLLHAITDALLGTLGGGDIGDYFPPSDPQWKNADSVIFIKHANKLIKENGGVINNIDTIVICEKPKLSNHKNTIKKRIAEILEIKTEQVTVKGKTTEKLGFTGREEGIAAQVICSITFKNA